MNSTQNSDRLNSLLSNHDKLVSLIALIKAPINETCLPDILDAFKTFNEIV